MQALKAATKARVKATDELGNVAYIHYGGGWLCTLANGINASLWYAGLGEDEVAIRFALDDCRNDKEVLETIRELGSPRTRYELV